VNLAESKLPPSRSKRCREKRKLDPVRTAKYNQWQRENYQKNKNRYRLSRQKYADKNREKERQWARNSKIKRRLEVLVYYSKGTPSCACCGEKEIVFLTIDHINGGGRKHRRETGYTHLFDWLRHNNYPSGFQILCYNCNAAKAINGECPHKQGAKIK
jgi:hypothetical protein